MSDLVLNVKQLSNYPAKTNATGLENILLQAGLGAPYQSITSGALVATALENNGSMGIGYGLPATPPPTSGQLFASNFIAPINGGFQFNTYLDAQGTLRYWNTGAAADWAYDQNAGFIWRRFPDGAAGQAITFPAPLMALSQAGNLTLYYGTLTVVRDPSNANEVATAGWVQNNTVQSFNNRQGSIKLNAQDVYQALQLTSPIATQDYTNTTINQSIQQLLMTCPFVNSWNGRSGSVYLTLSDITCVFFQSGQQPISPTPPATSDDNSIATTQWVTQHVGLSTGSGAIIANTPPANPYPGELWFDSVGVQLYVWYDDGTSQQWVIANNSGGGSSGGGGGSGSSNLLISASPPLNPVPGTLWWNTIDGNSYIYYDDGTSQQWVPATSTAGVVGGPFLPTAGGTVNGNVTVTTGLFSGVANAGMRAGGAARTWVGLSDLGYMTYYDTQSLAAFYPRPTPNNFPLAIAAAVRSSDVTPQPGQVPATIAFAAFATSDSTASGAAATYCFYGTGRKLAGATLPCFLMELSMGNLGTRPQMNPYQIQPAGSNYGVWLTSGSEASEAGEAVVPAGVAIATGTNGSTWDKGLIFSDGSLTKSGTGISIPIQFGRQAEIQWTFDASGARSAFIRCDATAADLGIVFASNAVNIVDNGETTNLFQVTSGSVNTALPYNGASVSASGGVHIPGTLGASGSDVTKHVELYVGAGYGFGVTAGSLNHVAGSGAIHTFYVGTTQVGSIGTTGIMTGPAGSPTWTSGSAAPASTQPAGSLYSRTAGATGTRLYVSAGGGTWNPVAGV